MCPGVLQRCPLTTRKKDGGSRGPAKEKEIIACFPCRIQKFESGEFSRENTRSRYHGNHPTNGGPVVCVCGGGDPHTISFCNQMTFQDL